MELFKGKNVVVTGGAQGIGKCIIEAFQSEGARAFLIDKEGRPEWFHGLAFRGDIARKDTIEAIRDVIEHYVGRVDFLINNAPPLMKGIEECSYDDFLYAQQVGVAAPFYLTKLLRPFMPEGSSIINISSTRDRMSQPQTESYAAAKGGLAALTHAMAVSLGPEIRVNAISPGWIDNTNVNFDGPDANQHPVGMVGKPEDIANIVLYLCSEKARFITGENICIDGGMTKLMIYHGDDGWKYEMD